LGPGIEIPNPEKIIPVKDLGVKKAYDPGSGSATLGGGGGEMIPNSTRALDWKDKMSWKKLALYSVQ
jgi:hypothetical protein